MITRSCGSSLCSRRDKGVHTDRRKDTQRYIPSSIALIKNIYLLQACFIGKLGAQLSCTVCLTRTACQMRQRSPWCCMLHVCESTRVSAYVCRCVCPCCCCCCWRCCCRCCYCTSRKLRVRAPPLGDKIARRGCRGTAGNETKRKIGSGRLGSVAGQ